MPNISFGEVDTTWQKYDLTEIPILYNGKASPYKVIDRNDALIAIVGAKYVLLPNEEALKIADESAKMCNLEPFFPKRSQNIIYNRKQTRMHAWYAPSKTHRIDSEDVKIGVDVRNGIDGGMSFGCGVFTYREICSNGVILGKQEMASITHLHTKGLTHIISNLKERMLLVMEKASDVAEAYRQMAQRKLTEELIKKIRESSIPKKVLPRYLAVEDGQTYLAEPTDLNEWNCYNDITEGIWHNDATDITTKTTQFNALHRVMPLVVV